MQKFVIEGGTRLAGEVKISGSKNASLPIIAASLLAKGVTVLHNVPDLMDVRTMAKILREMGVKVDFNKGTMVIDTTGLNKPEAPYELVSTMRASILVLGPLVARCGYAKVSRPGGCVIGPRPIDEHLRGLQLLGTDIKEESGYVIAKSDILKGTEIYLNERSVTATENIMMAATLAKGETQIINCACEPHVTELANFLRKMGAKVSFREDRFIIQGTKELHPCEYSIGSDYIETGTFMIASAITMGKLFLRGANPSHSVSEIAKLREIGVEIIPDDAGILVKATKRPKSTDIKTAPYPGFPTDLQPQICSLLCLAEGTSIVHEAMYESRYTHIPELQRMGANIKIEGREAIIIGVNKLYGAKVMASDIRCGAALVLAGLAAKGTTEVRRIYHIDRGYENLEIKLQNLGANIKREED